MNHLIEQLSTNSDLLVSTIIVGLVGVVFGVVGKIIWSWLNSNKKGDGSLAEDVKWLRAAHDKTDNDGVLLWYSPRELLKLTKQNHEKLTEVNFNLKEITNVLRENGTLLRELNKDREV